MARAVSVDLRDRVVAAVRFGVSLQTSICETLLRITPISLLSRTAERRGRDHGGHVHDRQSSRIIDRHDCRHPR
jgi:hypothetical protein